MSPQSMERYSQLHYNIDTTFDFRKDTQCGYPDTDSILLYKAHQALWNKELPCGKNLDLRIIKKGGRLLLQSSLCDNLSSDRMCPAYDGTYGCNFDGWFGLFKNRQLRYKARTIGGHIIFPAHQKNGFTVNQSRGINRDICDRFDLTLECIRRFYQEEESPLLETLVRYKNFFDLFLDFRGYIEFFMLQDFLDEMGQVRFSLPFHNFRTSPLPQTADEYQNYKIHILSTLNKRNKRIGESMQKKF